MQSFVSVKDWGGGAFVRKLFSWGAANDKRLRITDLVSKGSTRDSNDILLVKREISVKIIVIHKEIGYYCNMYSYFLQLHIVLLCFAFAFTVLTI